MFKKIKALLCVVAVVIVGVFLCGYITPEPNEWELISTIDVPVGINYTGGSMYTTNTINFSGKDLRIISYGEGIYHVMSYGVGFPDQIIPSEYIKNDFGWESLYLGIRRTETNCTFEVYQR